METSGGNCAAVGPLKSPYEPSTLWIFIEKSQTLLMSDLLVYNIEAATPSMLRSLDRHCCDREPDGASAIDQSRSHLNRILAGSEEGVLASLDQFYQGGVQRPTKQAESPYLRIVVSVSASYFRPDDPTAAGTWDQERLDAWLEATMSQLRSEHGDDLVYAELHLDEDTPHIHAVVAPTYSKKPRKPGRRKRNETEEEFEARKAAALAAEGVRAVGRASHPVLSKKGSYDGLRRRMAAAVAGLGIEYGQERQVDAPAGKSTREWVKEQAAAVAAKEAQIEADRAAARADREAAAAERRIQDGRKSGIDKMERVALLRYEANEATRRELDKREKVVAVREAGLRDIATRFKRLAGGLLRKLGLRERADFDEALGAIEAALAKPEPKPEISRKKFGAPLPSTTEKPSEEPGGPGF